MQTSRWILSRASRPLYQAGAATAPSIAFVASDLDGTMLAPSHAFSDFTRETLKYLAKERQVPITFATGRMHADVKVLSENLRTFFGSESCSEDRTQPTAVYLASANGAVIHDAITNTLLAEHCIPPSIVEDLYHVLPPSETRINTNLCQWEKWYARMDWQELLRYHQESGFKYEVLERLPTSISSDGRDKRTAVEGGLSHVTKMFFTSWDKERLEKLEDFLLRHYKYSDEVEINFSSHYCLDVMAKGVSKASALRRIYEQLPLQSWENVSNEEDAATRVDRRMSQTIAFGDDLNDARMLSSVGQGCVMANCNPRLKAACPELEVIAPNAENGPAQKLRQVFRF